MKGARDMFRGVRKSAMRVRDGRVQKKQRTAITPHYLTHVMPSLVVDRRKPGAGYRHVVTRTDVWKFVSLLPDWDELKKGLDAIVLDCGGGRMGWYRPGVVAICAWDCEIIWDNCYSHFFEAHREVFDKLEIEYSQDDGIRIDFTAGSARAFLLVHVLVHELGHHRDLMTTRSRRGVCRGEGYAEAYARRNEDEIILRYRQAFGY